MAKYLHKLSHPAFVTTGERLTIEQIDQTLIEIWEAVSTGGGGGTGGDTTPPAYSSAVLAPDGVTLDVALTETGSPPILPATGITGFSVTVGGSSRSIASATRQGDSVVRLVLASAANAGEAVTVAYSGGNVLDSAGNSMATFTAKTATNNSTQGGTGGPAVVSARLWPDGMSLHVTFDEALYPVGAGGAAFFHVYVNGVERTGKSGFVASGADQVIYKLTFSDPNKIAGGTTVTISYDGGYLTDADGNAAAAFAGQAVQNDSIQV